MEKFIYIQSYVNKMKYIQEMILNFLEDENSKENFSFSFIKYLDQEKIRENRHDIRLVLRIISQISENHYRTPGFLDKINQIVFLLKDEIAKFFTNFEIYCIFQNSMPLLVFLLENKILIPDLHIFQMMSSYEDIQYEYFYPEFKIFFDTSKNCHLKKIPDSIEIESFKEKRKIGENDSYLCQLIRNDSVEDFIAYVNLSKLSHSKTKIEKSIFETNLMLFGDDVFLIQYAAFFGSIEIFQYLQFNNVELESSIWDFAIHSNKPEMIHILEDLHVEPKYESFESCLYEAVRNHHNNIARYFQDNLVNSTDNILTGKLHSFNFSIFADSLDEDMIKDKNKLQALFYDLCQNDCYTLVEYLLNNTDVDINAKVI